MNTDKIVAESIVKDYAPKESSKIVALKKLDRKARIPAIVFTYTFPRWLPEQACALPCR